MDYIPKEDLIEDTPFGTVIHKKGVPLWLTAFRPEWHQQQLVFREDDYFGKSIEQTAGTNQIVGYDEYIGKQLMYCAWRDSSPIPIIRASTVPEMGNKARLVTVSEYWLNTLLSPFAHHLIEKLKWHPSVFSSFTRMDQAWESLLILMNGDPTTQTLFSDLKNATNALPFDVSRTLIEGFCEGA
jgi:hypothetical protein